MAPYARGTVHMYCPENARKDIMEALDDVIENYSIDTDNIVLGGGSMGAYGTCYTYYEYPDMFKALALFSGDPYLAGKYKIKGDHPNFLEEEFLAPFNDIPMFIYHSKEDELCDYKTAIQLAEKLEEAGAKVEFFLDEKGSHNVRKKGYRKFNKWLERIIKSDD